MIFIGYNTLWEYPFLHLKTRVLNSKSQTFLRFFFAIGFHYHLKGCSGFLKPESLAALPGHTSHRHYAVAQEIGCLGIFARGGHVHR